MCPTRRRFITPTEHRRLACGAKDWQDPFPLPPKFPERKHPITPEEYEAELNALTDQVVSSVRKDQERRALAKSLGISE